MNFGTMIETVFRLMRDNLETKYDRDSIKRWLNEGERKYCNETGYSVKKDTSLKTQASVQEYPLPSDCKNIIGVYCDNERLTLCDQLETIDTTVASGIPYNFYIRNNAIGMYPPPAVVHDLTILYRALGGGMDATGDIPIIPEEHQYIPIWWACYLCSLEGDDARINHFRELFFTELKGSVVDIVNKVFPGVNRGVSGEEVNHDYNRIR